MWTYVYSDELYHYGVKGMKWGVRRYQNPDGTLTAAGKKRQDKTVRKINSMYDHANKWTGRKITKLDAKGKTAKADVMREMYDRNEKARDQKVKNVKSMSAEEYSKSRKQDFKDYFGQGQLFMDRNAVNMTTAVSRLGEYQIQRGMRWASNFTLNSTLARMSASEGYEYLNKKNIYNLGYSSAPSNTVYVY